MRAKAVEKIEKSQSYNKLYYDKKKKEAHCYKIGDYVMTKNFENTPGCSKKLVP